MNPTITFIGGGNMARSLIGGLLAQGFEPSRLQVSEPHAATRDALAQALGIAALDDNRRAAAAGQVWLLAVKPQVVKAVCLELRELAQQQRPLVLSIAAGIPTPRLDAWLGGGLAVVRCMPNTPALIGAGITGLFADASVDAAGRAAAEEVLAAVGSTVWVQDEAQIDGVTAISGSGPAYVFHFIECLQASGEALGFEADTARKLAIDTVLGAARLAAGSAESPAVLRERVTSKGGTTAAALASMAADGFPDVIRRAVVAAEARGRELGDELGRD